VFLSTARKCPRPLSNISPLQLSSNTCYPGKSKDNINRHQEEGGVLRTDQVKCDGH